MRNFGALSHPKNTFQSSILGPFKTPPNISKLSSLMIMDESNPSATSVNGPFCWKKKLSTRRPSSVAGDFEAKELIPLFGQTTIFDLDSYDPKYSGVCSLQLDAAIGGF